MRSMIPILAAAVTLGGCSTFRATEPPVCDGRHRRPANLYGSVLNPTVHPVAPEPADDTPEVDAPADDQTPVMPAPAPAPGGCA
jgi:type IV secretion system protein VirB7